VNRQAVRETGARLAARLRATGDQQGADVAILLTALAIAGMDADPLWVPSPERVEEPPAEVEHSSIEDALAGFDEQPAADAFDRRQGVKVEDRPDAFGGPPGRDSTFDDDPEEDLGEYDDLISGEPEDAPVEF
jgi:hypothetical protein